MNKYEKISKEIEEKMKLKCDLSREVDALYLQIENLSNDIFQAQEKLKQLEKKDAMKLGSRSKRMAEKTSILDMLKYAATNDPILHYEDSDSDEVIIYLDEANNHLFEVYQETDGNSAIAHSLYFDGAHLERYCKYEQQWERMDYSQDYWTQKEARLRKYAIELKANETLEKELSK